jgi:hypothetical protein
MTLFLLSRARKERAVFQKLLGMVPRLTERLMEGSNEDAMAVADLVCTHSTEYYLIVFTFI